MDDRLLDILTIMLLSTRERYVIKIALTRILNTNSIRRKLTDLEITVLHNLKEKL